MAAGFENTFFASSVFVMALDRSCKVGEPWGASSRAPQGSPTLHDLSSATVGDLEPKNVFWNLEPILPPNYKNVVLKIRALHIF